MIEVFPQGLLSSNTYVVWDEHSLDCMIVDCGVEVNDVLPFILEKGLNVKYVVLTHGHFDHAHFVRDYEKQFSKAQIICHEKEKDVLYDPYANLSAEGDTHFIYDCNYTYVKEGDLLTLGKKSDEECMIFQILSTPGHTPGSICLYDEKHQIMLTGDTLFKRSYGRTDFKYGDMQQMFFSLRRLYRMDKNITFYPGHNDPSTIGEETSR